MSLDGRWPATSSHQQEHSATISGFKGPSNWRHQHNVQTSTKRMFQEVLTEGIEQVHNSISKQNEKWNVFPQLCKSCIHPSSQFEIQKLTDTAVKPTSKWMIDIPSTDTESSQVPSLPFK